MGTRSKIAIANADGTVQSIYCHWEGYVSNNGFLLLCHYQDVDKVKKMIGFGDMSSLREKIDFVGVHTYDNAQEDVTVFYGRDSKETGVSAKKFASLETYKQKNDFQEYDYIYVEKKKKWYLYNPENGKFTTLESEVKKARGDMDHNKLQVFNNYLKEKKIKKEYEKMQKELILKEVSAPKMKM